MNTTLLFAELLIFGIQVSVWLSLIILTLFGASWVNISGIADWQNIVAVAFLAFCYALGVVFDRFADTVFGPWNDRLKVKMVPDPPFAVSAGIMALELGKNNEFLDSQFEYTRSRIRIARASTIKFSIPTRPESN